MSDIVSTSYAKAHFAELMERAAAGERIRIRRGKRVIAVLVAPAVSEFSEPAEKKVLANPTELEAGGIMRPAAEAAKLFPAPEPAKPSPSRQETKREPRSAPATATHSLSLADIMRAAES